jgi:probable phosphoglycerate mutase
MTELLLIRHAQSTYNAQRRWAGAADPPLTAEGEAAAELAARGLAGVGIEVAVASGLERARRTAEIVASVLGLDAPGVEPALAERDVGEWSGLTSAEIDTGWPGMLDAYRAGELAAPPGGEPLDAFLARVRRGVTRVARMSAGRRTLVVTHAGVLRAVERIVGTEPAPPVNCAGRWVHVDDEGLAIGAFWAPAEASGPAGREVAGGA